MTIVDKIDLWVIYIQISSKVDITHTRVLSEKKYYILIKFQIPSLRDFLAE